MASAVKFGQTNTTPYYQPKEVGSINNKKVIPVSHADGFGQAGKTGMSLCGTLELIMFIVGIALWAAGAANGNPGMVIAGKVLFSLSFVSLAVTVVALYCVCGCLCCASQAAGGGANLVNAFIN